MTPLQRQVHDYLHGLHEREQRNKPFSKRTMTVTTPATAPPDLTAPGDPTFTYRATPPDVQAKGWRWVTAQTYGYAIDRERYPALHFLCSAYTHTTTRTLYDQLPFAALLPLDNVPTLEVRRGYAWDGSTGGTEGPAGRRASCLHDALYQIMRDHELDWPAEFRDEYRRDADRLFLDVQREDGMSWWRRRLRWLAVRLWPDNRRVQGPSVYDDREPRPEVTT